jgi:hypothetical protein
MWLPVLAILLSLLGLPFVVATAFVREGEPGIEVVYGRSRLRQHDLRHSRITWLLAEGAPIQTVQGLAGHSTVKMTERYYRYLHEHQRILVERAGTLGTFLHRSRRPQQVEQLVVGPRREGGPHRRFTWRDRRVAQAQKSESGPDTGLRSPTDLDDGPPVPLVVSDDSGSHNAQEPYFERQRTERLSLKS